MNSILGPSWQPKLIGLAGFLIVLCQAAIAQLDNDPNTVANWPAVLAAATTTGALFRARQTNVSSEQHGVTAP